MKKYLIALLVTLIYSNMSYGAMQASIVQASAITRTDTPVIITLGDSLTDGTGDPDLWGYRNHIQDELGIHTYTLVGNINSPSSPGTYDNEHGGIGGETVPQIESRTQALLNDDPLIAVTNNGTNSIALVLAGGNDVLNQVDSDAIIAGNVIDIVNIIDSHNSTIDIYVSNYPGSKNSIDNTNLADYSIELKSQVVTRQGTKSNLVFVDMQQAFVNDTWSLCSGDWKVNCMDPTDNVHPNDLGYQVMAKQWTSCISSSTNTNCNGN